MKKLRVFVSSPGDVQIERNVARNVINELNSLYSEHIKIEVLMWEDFPLSAGATFQEGINYFLTDEPIDLAVFILWSRLGTPLSVNFRKEDGTPYNSGTEYEFDLMMKLHKTCGHPSRILTYVKKDDSYPKDCSWDELREILRQKEGLDCFLKEYFRDDETNSNYAYMPFGKKVSFENVFRTHLKNAIKEYIGEVEDLKEWDGNPYVGLKSFDYDQASIFFGRRQLVYETASKLIPLDDGAAVKSLIVLGESGSGKSSFVKAGLLPFLCSAKQSAYDYVIVNPSMYAGYFYDGLLDIVQEKMKFLSSHPFMAELRKGITCESNFEYLAYELESRSANPLIIYIDQFEELFSDNLITEEERQKVILLIRGLVSMGKIAVFMSMRSDFYNRFSVYEEMSQIKGQCEVLDLPVMGATEITEIIEEPARKACLRWEVDAKGFGLNRQVLRDAMSIKELPLIEFALSELYEARTENDVLTKEAYDKMGGLRGAVVNYADKCYARLSEAEKEALEDILGFVVTESTSHKETYVRRTSVKSDMEKSPLHKEVVNKLLADRLFVAGKDSEGRATVTIVHEVLLKSWSVVSGWVEREKEFISTNRHYEQLAQYWVNGNRKKPDLIRGRSSLLEAEYFHFRNRHRVSTLVLDYLKQSFINENKGGLPWLVIVAVFMSLTCAVVLLYKCMGLPIGISSIDQASFMDLFLCLGAVLLVIYHGIALCRSRQPKYNTIRAKVIVWSVATLMMAVYSVIDQPDWISMIITLLFPFAPMMIYLFTQVKELGRRRKWTRKYVGYSISDEFWMKFKTISVSLLVIFAMMTTAITYYLELEDQKDQFAAVADELFDGLNNFKDRLTYTDNKYLNERRMQYLERHFSDDLMDAYGDEKDMQYARALYNIYEPQMALEYLDKDSRWDHHLLEILCQYALGNYDAAESSLEEYVLGGEYNEIDNFLSTSNLIWYSEVLGRFDLVSRLDSIVADKPRSDYAVIAGVLNKGHVALSQGDLELAEETYNEAFAMSLNMGYVDESGNSIFKNNLKNDLHVFSRFESLPDHELKKMADIMGVEFVPAYVPKAKIDSAYTESLMSKLIGNWTWHDDQRTISLRVDPESKSFTYVYTDGDGVERAKSVVECRVATADGEIYWDEFYPMEDYNGFGKLLELEEDHFVLEIIENGIPDDKGTKRRYQRVD